MKVGLHRYRQVLAQEPVRIGTIADAVAATENQGQKGKRKGRGRGSGKGKERVLHVSRAIQNLRVILAHRRVARRCHVILWPVAAPLLLRKQLNGMKTVHRFWLHLMALKALRI